jgi:hypothetical protein
MQIHPTREFYRVSTDEPPRFRVIIAIVIVMQPGLMVKVLPLKSQRVLEFRLICGFVDDFLGFPLRTCLRSSNTREARPPRQAAPAPHPLEGCPAGAG